MTPIGAAARTTRESKRRSRSAIGATAGRIHRAGTSRNGGHRRRAQATMRSCRRLSIAALRLPGIARGYALASLNGDDATPRPRSRASADRAAPARPPLPPGRSGPLGATPCCSSCLAAKATVLELPPIGSSHAPMSGPRTGYNGSGQVALLFVVRYEHGRSHREDARSPTMAGAPEDPRVPPAPSRGIVEPGLQLATAQRATPGSSYPPSAPKGTNASLSRALSRSRSSSGSPRTNIANGPPTSTSHCS
jgi:hypothetical protein